MKRLSIRIAIVLILFGSLGRMQMIRRSGVNRVTDLQHVRSVITPLMQSPNPLRDPSLRKLGVTRIEFQRFDPGAVVLMQAGPDRQPGVARVDDDRNGTIDDRSELGATYSDDVCSVELSNVQDSDVQDDANLVLQYGAFVPATYDQLIGETPARAIVFGQSTGEDRWSFMVEMDGVGSEE